MIVKICGIRSADDLRVAIDAGANRVGFLVGLTHVSEDGIDVPFAAELVAATRDGVASVLVTHLADPSSVVALFEQVRSTVVQLHGEMSVEQVAGVRRRLPDVRLVRAVHVAPLVAASAVIAEVDAVEPFVDEILLDSRTPNRLGGTGEPHDWSVSAQVVRRSSRPVMLAGGLNPENVRAAIARVRPAGVDANSGVEDAIGNKSGVRARLFVDRAQE